MKVRVAWRIGVAVLAMCLANVVPAGADGGDLLWKIEGDSAGLGSIRYVAEDSNRLLAVGWSGRFTPTQNPTFLVRLQDAATGTPLWTHADTSAAGGFANHGILKGARAYVVGVVSSSTPFYSAETRLLVRVYDARSGTVVWEDRPDPSLLKPGTSTYGQGLVLAGGRLFVASTYFGPIEQGTLIRAYDAETGRLLWQQIRPQEILEDYHAMLPVAGNVLFALIRMDESGLSLVVRAHSANTGATAWEDVYSVGGYTLARAAIANVAGRVFVLGLQGADFGGPDLIVRAYDGMSGALLWQDVRTAPAGHTASAIATAGSYVFASGTAADDTTLFSVVRALDTFSGSVIWESVADLNDGEVWDMAVLGDRLITVGLTYWPNYEMLVRTHDIRTGAVLWEDRHNVGSGVDYALAVSAVAGRVVAVGAGSTASGDESILMRAYRPK